MVLPTGPGWGIDINEAAVRARPPAVVKRRQGERRGEIQDRHPGRGQFHRRRAAATTTRWSRWRGSTASSSKCQPTEDGFIKAAPEADAIYAKGMKFTKKMIDALPAKCRGIVLGSVGVDSVDVAAATARGMPVTNCPDTFIEEVADHAMTLLLAGHRRMIEQDRMVRDGRWREGRPALLQIPRLMGQTLGLDRLRPRRPRGGASAPSRSACA